jgi:arginine exporter protein ArgO
MYTAAIGKLYIGTQGTSGASESVKGIRDMTSFWEGVLAGYGIAIPVGAIAVLIVDVGLRRGFRFSFAAGAGAAAADFVYAGLAAVAGEALASALAPYALGLRIASTLLLLGLGGYGLWRARQIGAQQDTHPAAGDSANPFRTFAQFLGLTLLNPLTVAYFGALILGRGTESVITAADRTAFVIGAALASLSWQTLLAGVGALAKTHLSPRFQMYASVTGNLVVIGLGLRVFVDIVT